LQDGPVLDLSRLADPRLREGQLELLRGFGSETVGEAHIGNLLLDGVACTSGAAERGAGRRLDGGAGDAADQPADDRHWHDDHHAKGTADGAENARGRITQNGADYGAGR